MEGIIAAGALAPQSLREQGIERIPLLRVGGETILARTCRCLKEGGGCEVIHILAPEEVPLPETDGVRRAQYSGKIVSDMMRCVREDVQGAAVLLSSGDMPQLTPGAVAAVCSAARASGADVLYPAVARPVMEDRFPGSKRTYVKLGKVVVTGGNVFWLNRDWILGQSALLEHLFAQRKNPLGLARIFGPGFFLRILLGMAGLDYIEAHLSRVLKGRLRAAVIPFPEIAADLDKPADLATFEPVLDPRD